MWHPKTQDPQPLQPVEVTPLPEQEWFYPFASVEEYVEAIKKENEALITKWENAELRAGRMPATLIWWKAATAGLGIILTALASKGCF